MKGEYIGIVSHSLYGKLEILLPLLERRFYKNPHKALKREYINNSAHRSVDIEDPGRRLKKRELRKMYSNAQDALRVISSKDWRELDESDFKEVNFRITREEYGYRQMRAYIVGAENSLPSPERVIREMPLLLKLFEDKINPLETAILIHFHGVRIHPFSDGNGRTFRLVQNCILYQEGIPSPSLREEEREEYIRLIEAAAMEWLKEYNKGWDSPRLWEKQDTPQRFYSQLIRRGCGENLNRFADFVASKVIRVADSYF